MDRIETTGFDKASIEELKNKPLGVNWPVVYFLRNNSAAYIGQTTGLYDRARQHFMNPKRRELKTMHILTDEEYNVSAALDIESLLIQYVAAEGTYKLQNGNGGLVDHNYFDKPRYRAKFQAFWSELKNSAIIKRDLNDVKNSEFFKYSPYKALTPDQLEVAEELIGQISASYVGVHIVNGGPGTGKSVLATYLIKALKDRKETKDLKIALVISMTALRKTLEKVFRSIDGLSSAMVIGPSEVVRQKYDVLIVDEAHRLRRRKGITGYGAHDAINKLLGLPKDGTELDWILASSKHQILFYDENQTIRPADVLPASFKSLNATHHRLTTQQRVEGGDKYINFIENIFSGEKNVQTNFENYDFKIYDDAAEMVHDIRQKNDEYGLSRIVAGYAWEWVSREDKKLFDIEIGDVKLRWNSKLVDWVNSSNAINEVGCIHTIQGYDLNYVGVIIGPELAFDSATGQLLVKSKNYKDIKGMAGVDEADLKLYVLNIYKTLLTRGIKGCYVYFVDKGVERLFKSRIAAS